MNRCMRTNIVLDDDLVAEAMRYSTARSKTALVEEALRVLVETRSSAQRKESYERRLRALQRRLATTKPRESAVAILRRDRERE